MHLGEEEGPPDLEISAPNISQALCYPYAGLSARHAEEGRMVE